MGAVESAFSDVPKDIRDTLINVSNNLKDGFSEGVHSFNTLQNNTFSIVKTGEDGIIRIVRDGVEIVSDIEENAFKTIRQLIDRGFEVITIAEKGILQIGATIERDIAEEVREIPRLVVNTINETRRDVLTFFDDRADRAQNQFKTSFRDIIQTFQVLLSMSFVIGAFVAVSFGKELYLSAIEIIGNVAVEGVKSIGGAIGALTSFIPLI